MGIDRLSAADRLLVDASARWPQEIGGIVILDGGPLVDPDGRFRLEAVRGAIGARLHRVRRLRQSVHAPRRGLGGPLWIDDASFDVERHVGLRAIAPPGDDASLAAAASSLWREPMDLAHPLWRMWFLTGLTEGRIGLFVRIHHAVADGRAAMVMLDALLDRQPDAASSPPRPWRPRRPPSPTRLLFDRLVRGFGMVAASAGPLLHPLRTAQSLREAAPAVRELVGEPPASPTSLHRLLGPGRAFAMLRGDLHRLRRAARAQGATVNDLVLSLAGAGVRSLLRGRGEPTRGVVVRAYVPVSMRRRLRGGEEGTAIAQMVVPLTVEAAEPAERLRRIAAETRRRKARARTSVGTLFAIGFLRRRLLALVSRQRVNLSTTFLAGPRRPRYLAGARVLEVFPTMNLIGTVSLGVCATSYAGALLIGVTADEDAYPDLDRFVAGVREEMADLLEPAIPTMPDMPTGTGAAAVGVSA